MPSQIDMELCSEFIENKVLDQRRVLIGPANPSLIISDWLTTYLP